MQRCHTAWPISGSPSLDGVYTLLEERPLIDLTPQDREICQVLRKEMRNPYFGDIFLNPKSGCVYARSGSPGKEEYCFAGTSCPPFGLFIKLALDNFSTRLWNWQFILQKAQLLQPPAGNLFRSSHYFHWKFQCFRRSRESDAGEERAGGGDWQSQQVENR